MKILLDLVAPDTAGTPRSGAAYHAQWRKALEDAQWQARQRIAREPGNEARVAGDTAQRDDPAGCGAARQASADMPTALQSRVAPDVATARADALARAAVAAAQAQPALRSTAGGATIAATVEPVVAQPVPASAGEPAIDPAQPQWLQWSGLPEWPSVVVHASLNGTRISIVIRDRTLEAADPADTAALCERLESQLRTAGLELASLTLNGQDVTGAATAGALDRITA